MSKKFDYAPWKPPFHYDSNGTFVLDAKDRLIVDVRGWGFLTGKGGIRSGSSCGLNETTAVAIQNALGEHVAQLLNTSSVLTITELRDQLSGRFPRRTIAVSETAWAHMRFALMGSYVEYVIAVQPGFDGHLNQNFGGNSLDECIEKFNKAAEGHTQ